MSDEPRPDDHTTRRSLDDRGLRPFQPLRRAERILWLAYQTGSIARIGLRRPTAPTPENTVRAAFIAHLARRGGSRARTPARRIELLGAWIEGRLDLRDADVPATLWLYRCTFDAAPRLDGARFADDVGFPDSSLPALHADDGRFAGDLALNAGCAVAGDTRVSNARIGGDLNCTRARLGCDAASAGGASVRPLVAERTHVSGNVLLNDGFESIGEVRLAAAQVDGDVRASRAHVTGNVDSHGMRHNALCMDRINVAGSVFLDSGFAAAGTVRLHRARIDGDLDCSGASFDTAGDATWSDGAALLLDRAVVAGTLRLQKLPQPVHGASFVDTQIGALVDDESTWGEELVLDGLHYERFAEGAPTDSRFRLSWLDSQTSSHLGAEFRPDPWRQVIVALRRGGHDGAAREVAIARETRLRRIGRIGEATPPMLRWLTRAGHAMFGAVAGYGYRPLRLVACVAGVWLLCGVLYGVAAERGVMAPTDKVLFDDVRYAHCRPDDVASRRGPAPPRRGNWTDCDALPAEYPTFSALAFSLDVVLPLVDLGQERHWAPMVATLQARASDEQRERRLWGQAVRVAAWVETLVGWLAALTLIASLAGWTVRDRER